MAYGDGAPMHSLRDLLSRFGNMSSHARNYHNWKWDSADPNIAPSYDEMVARGSTNFGVIPGHSSASAKDWLNWDNEYTA